MTYQTWSTANYAYGFTLYLPVALHWYDGPHLLDALYINDCMRKSRRYSLAKCPDLSLASYKYNRIMWIKVAQFKLKQSITTLTCENMVTTCSLSHVYDLPTGVGKSNVPRGVDSLTLTPCAQQHTTIPGTRKSHRWMLRELAERWGKISLPYSSQLHKAKDNIIKMAKWVANTNTTAWTALPSALRVDVLHVKHSTQRHLHLNWRQTQNNTCKHATGFIFDRHHYTNVYNSDVYMGATTFMNKGCPKSLKYTEEVNKWNGSNLDCIY